MLKHKRKVNKAALIESSLMYGLTRIDVTKYRAFHQLVGFHGPLLAARMVADALQLFPDNAGRLHCGIWGFVVWRKTNYEDEWSAASSKIPC